MPTLVLSAGASRDRRVQRRVPSAPLAPAGVTAVVTAHNYGRYLAHCVRSALDQAAVDAQVVIVDDCSTDDTPAVAAELSLDPRVTVIRNQTNLGLVGAFNRGLARVNTEYVVKLDADDLMPTGAWARATALLERHPEVAFVYGRPHNFIGSAPVPAPAGARSWTIWTGHDWIACRCRSGANVISQPEVVMRTEALRRVGGLCAEAPAQTSDMSLWLKLAATGDVARINGVVQGLYRVHEASMLRTTHAGMVCDLEGRRGAFDAAFAGAAGTLPGAEELHRLAWRSLAVTALEEACRAYDRGRTAEKPVEDLIAFALETCSEARQLEQWKALQRRRAVGPQRAPRHPHFFADAVTRRISDAFCRWHWLRTGEW